MASKKTILFPVVFMVVLTIIYTSILAFINESTTGIIKDQENLRIKRSVLYVLNLPVSEDDEAVKKLYSEKITEEEKDDVIVYVYTEGGVLYGYAFAFTGTGLWGTISGYLGTSPDYSQLTGVDFVSHSETPGLGGRIDEAWFKEQFRGIQISGENTVIFKPAEGGNADAITGATLTSDSVRNMINTFITDLLVLTKEANL